MSAIARRTSTAAAPTCGREDGAPHPPERVAQRERLERVGDVEGAPQPARSDLRGEGGEVHDPAARHVHDGRAVGQEAQGRAVEEAARRVGEARGDDEVLGLAEQARERHGLGARARARSRRGT